MPVQCPSFVEGSARGRAMTGARVGRTGPWHSAGPPRGGSLPQSNVTTRLEVPQTMSHVPVEVRGLVKAYGPNRVVDGVDLTVEEGAVYGYLGPNGAGKTTTLRMMLGL